MSAILPLEQHNTEIAANLRSWEAKPVLRELYRDFHRRIARHLAPGIPGITAELGSGIGNIKEVIPYCLRTDIFPNPWLDQVEDAYRLSFRDGTVANLILFDVFHHLEFPGTALKEFARVLAPGGRVILFEPYVSLLGRLVYGVFHHEPIALQAPIEWDAPPSWSPTGARYYAAQGNATRIFFWNQQHGDLTSWSVVARERLAALSYVASGGYSKPLLYPPFALPLMRYLDQLADFFPQLFATRALVVLQSNPTVP